eukprot:gene18844-24629_t
MDCEESILTIQSIENEQRTDEFMLPMRDGVKLHSRIVYPKGFDSSNKYTTIVDRSPYGYLGLEWMIDLFLPYGFVTIGQDMRGTQTSEGDFSIWHADANDSQDLGDWIVQQEWSNGVVYSFGASADGLGAFTMPENNPSWLEAQYMVWSSSTGYDVIFPNGAYLQALTEMWIDGTVPDDAESSLAIIVANEARTEWWDPLDLTGKFNLVHAKSGFWAGWYDIFLVGNLHAYNGYNYESDESVRYSSKLLIDPLGHCQDAAEYFPNDLIMGRTLLGLAQAYEVFGVRPVVRNNIQNITFYVMSSNDDVGLSSGQYWTTMEKFPVPTMTDFYLHSDGTASLIKPSVTEKLSSSYVYDPSNPVPTVGGNNLAIPCGPLDQSEVDSRSDVLTFTTNTFSNELALTGPLYATLFVSSDAIDTDFTVKISDVYPTGEVRLLQDSAIRMRWRQGGLTPVYMEANEIYEVTLSLWNTSYVVAPGHALRFSISSSNYPRFSVNRNNGILLSADDQGDVIVANNVIYHSFKYASYVSLPVVNKRLQLPKVHDIKAEVEKAYPDVDFEKMVNIVKEHPEVFQGKFTKQ